MKQYITTLHSATAAICTAALVATIAACTATEPHALPTTTDPLTALAPTTPVGIAATLKPYGNGTATRTTTHAHLQAIPAAGEITLNTLLMDLPQSGPINRTHAPATTTRANATPITPANAMLQLPGAKEETNTGLNLYGSTNTVGNIGSAPLYTDDPMSPEQLNSNGTLKLKNFNLSPTTADGASQPHSRIGILRLYTREDELTAIAPITTATDAEGTPIATMPFTLKHTGAKVSVLLVTPDNTPIDATTATLNSAHIAVRRARAYFIYTGTGNSTAGYPELFNYLRGEQSDGTYPHDPTPLATNTALALTPLGTGDTEFSLAHPATATTSADATPAVPSNLINGLIPACPTHSSSNNDNNTYYTPLDTPRPYQPGEALILKMNIATGQGTATKEVTYTLPLPSIALTGLPDGDPRINTQGTDNTGTLTYLRPGEHLVLTVTVDTDLQTITATATVGAWSTGTATGTPTEQPTGAAPTE